MKKLLFALYDSKGYMERFSEFMTKKNFLADCRLFTKPDSLQDFLKKKKPDVLLLGEEVLIEKNLTVKDLLEKAGQIIVMTEEKEQEDMSFDIFSGLPKEMASDTENISILFKYQSAEEIFQEISQIVKSNSAESISSATGNTEFLGICHPFGEPLFLHRILSANGEYKKTLLIDMEIISGIEPSEQPDEAIRGVSELIFYLKQKSEKLAGKIKALAREWEGIDYLCPVEDYRDLYSLEREDVDRLLTVLANECEYEQVIFQVGYFSEAALYLLYCCDKVFAPKAKNSVEEIKKRSLEKLLKKEGLEDIIRNLRYVS